MSTAPNTNSTSAQIGILMAVYNGAEYLPQQLESIAGQSHTDWKLITSNDNSADQSAALIADFAREHPVVALNGPGQGGTANFMSLIRRAPDYLPKGSWLAFSDQDDVWLPEKLSLGVAALGDVDSTQPALYCSRTWVVDEALNQRELSPDRGRAPGFLNALVQNIAAGNTILLNPAAATLVMAAAGDTDALPVVHDWWAYQMVTGAGGVVVFDGTPTLLYRQHGDNEIGANRGAKAQAYRFAMLIGGGFCRWNDANITALNASAHRLTASNRALLQEFAALRKAPFVARIGRLRRLRLYRQGAVGTLALWIATLLGRM